MSTLFISHPACLEHLTPDGHPERPDRLRAITRALEAEKFQALARVQAPRAALETIALCHPMDYITQLRDATPTQGLVQLDADTSISPGSFEAALRAAGGAVHAVDEVLTKKAANAFVAARPPAVTPRPRGRSASACSTMPPLRRGTRRNITALCARRSSISTCVAGNGSQEIFWADKTVMYCSTHQMPLYPGTGAVGENGEYDTVVNAPLRPGDGGEAFRAAFDNRVLPRLRDFRPELIVISAGFDAHMRDPLANLNLVEADFAWATRRSWMSPICAPTGASCRCWRAATTSKRWHIQRLRTSPR